MMKVIIFQKITADRFRFLRYYSYIYIRIKIKKVMTILEKITLLDKLGKL